MLYLFLFYTMKFMAYNFRYQRVMGTRHAFYFKLPLKLKKKKKNCTVCTFQIILSTIDCSIFLTNLFLFVQQLVDCTVNHQFQADGILQPEKQERNEHLNACHSVHRSLLPVWCSQAQRYVFLKLCQQTASLTASACNLSKWQVL